jgi:hypothetical protein
MIHVPTVSTELGHGMQLAIHKRLHPIAFARHWTVMPHHQPGRAHFMKGCSLDLPKRAMYNRICVLGKANCPLAPPLATIAQREIQQWREVEHRS